VTYGESRVSNLERCLTTLITAVLRNVGELAVCATAIGYRGAREIDWITNSTDLAELVGPNLEVRQRRAAEDCRNAPSTASVRMKL